MAIGMSYVDDVVASFEKAIEQLSTFQAEHGHKLYFVAPDRFTTLRDLVEILQLTTPLKI